MTLGAGGHAEALLSAGVGRLVGVDRDPSALALAGERLAEFGARFQPVRARFSEVDEDVVDGPVDGVLFDLGVSSMQLDRPERGFSYREDGPLDMRMGDEGPTAADLVNELPEKELADLIFEYGQETEVASDRRRDRPRAIARADRGHGRAGRHRRGRRGTTSGGPPPRASDVPGAPHRGQPGDRGARRLPASGGRPPRSRGPRGRHRVPLARGPHREADVPRERPPRDLDEEAAAALRRPRSRRTPAHGARSSARPNGWRRPRERSRTGDRAHALARSGALGPKDGRCGSPNPKSVTSVPRLPRGHPRRARRPMLLPDLVGGRAAASTRRSWCSPRSSSSCWCWASWR